MGAKQDENDVLPNHCANNGCSWCRERLARKRRASIEESRAREAAAGVTYAPHWETPISSAMDVLGYWPAHGIPASLLPPRPEDAPKAAWGGRGVKYLHEPADRTGHRKHRTGWGRGS